MSLVEYHGIQQPEDGIHVPYAFAYETSLQREGATGFASGDIGKLALQKDNASLWMLKAIEPATWERVSYDSSHVHPAPETFKQIRVDGQADIPAGSEGVINFVGGNDIVISTNPEEQSITISKASDNAPGIHGLAHVSPAGDPIPEAIALGNPDLPSGQPGLFSASDKRKLDSIQGNAGSNQNAFSFVAANGISIPAVNTTDTLTLASGNNISLDPDPITKTITIHASASGGGETEIHGIRHTIPDQDLIPDAVANGASGLMAGVEKAKLRDIEPMAQVNPTIIGTPPITVVSSSDKKNVTISYSASGVASHGSRHIIEGNSGDFVPLATRNSHGLMSKDYAKKLEDLNLSTDVATTTKSGLMPFTDKIRLNGMEDGAQKAPIVVGSGSNVTVAPTTESDGRKKYTISVTGGGASGGETFDGITGALNLGDPADGEQPVYARKNGNDLEFRSVKGGRDISVELSEDDNSLILDYIGTASGVSNYADVFGYRLLNTDDNKIKTLQEGDGIALEDNGESIIITATGISGGGGGGSGGSSSALSSITNVGTGVGVYKDVNSGQARLRSIRGINGVNVEPSQQDSESSILISLDSEFLAGEETTAANKAPESLTVAGLATGEKDGPAILLKSLKAGPGITINGTNEDFITISAGENVGVAQTEVVVSGKSNVFAAGRLNTAAFVQGGTLPPWVSFTTGTGREIRIDVATGAGNFVNLVDGSEAYGAAADGGYAAPVGNPFPTAFPRTNISSAGGISGIRHDARSGFLVGVFLADASPENASPPATVDFTNIAESFPTLSPLIGQAFFIGDGKVGYCAEDGTPFESPNETAQVFMVPASATRLFLGFADANNVSGALTGAPGYYDANTGQLRVTVKISGAEINGSSDSNDSGITSHDRLNNLNADDHTQYVHISTDRTITATHTYDEGKIVIQSSLGSTTTENIPIPFKIETDGQFNAAAALAIYNRSSAPGFLRQSGVRVSRFGLSVHNAGDSAAIVGTPGGDSAGPGIMGAVYSLGDPNSTGGTSNKNARAGLFAINDPENTGGAVYIANAGLGSHIKAVTGNENSTAPLLSVSNGQKGAGCEVNCTSEGHGFKASVIGGENAGCCFWGGTTSTSSALYLTKSNAATSLNYPVCEINNQSGSADSIKIRHTCKSGKGLFVDVRSTATAGESADGIVVDHYATGGHAMKVTARNDNDGMVVNKSGGDWGYCFSGTSYRGRGGLSLKVDSTNPKDITYGIEVIQAARGTGILSYLQSPENPNPAIDAMSSYIANASVIQDEYTAIDISSFANGDTLTFYGNPVYPIGARNYVDIPFNIPGASGGNNVWWSNVGGAGPHSLSLSVNAVHATAVHILANVAWGSGYGSSGLELVSVSFVGTGGVNYTKTLISLNNNNAEIRPYRTGEIGTYHIGGVDGITLRNVYYDGINALDMITIPLPSGFSTQTLTNITITDNGAEGLQRIFVKAVTVASAGEASTDESFWSYVGKFVHMGTGTAIMASGGTNRDTSYGVLATGARAGICARGGHDNLAVEAQGKITATDDITTDQDLIVHGNQTVEGTKSAVVATSQGKKKLYAEESADVWFSDYGFGRLDQGKTTILIENIFGETIDLDHPYHVFIQAYGVCNGVDVTSRNRAGFIVEERQDGKSSVEFGYRIVGKRKGYTNIRLESISAASTETKQTQIIETPDAVPGA